MTFLALDTTSKKWEPIKSESAGIVRRSEWLTISNYLALSPNVGNTLEITEPDTRVTSLAPFQLVLADSWTVDDK